jgi:putative heme-binding domain-containing protein
MHDPCSLNPMPEIHRSRPIMRDPWSPQWCQFRAAQGGALWLTVLLTAITLHAADTVPQLPVTDGLEVWLNAKQSVADTTLGGAVPVEGQPIELWSDASGRQRDARQPIPTARPELIRVGSSALFRFDGVDDHFRVTGLDCTLEPARVFVVAAPRENPGGFRALLAANEVGRRDFETGFTIDMGPFATTSLSQLNVEGRGFIGARSLANEASPFGTLHVVEIAIDPAAKEVRLIIDGQRHGTRPLEPSPIRIDELTIGARYYSLAPGPQQVTGFVAADIAEIVIYGRDLTNDEATSVRDYLLAKHADLARELPPIQLADGGVSLESIANPPPVQMFVPGFEVRELPLSLPNINNVRYRPDGKLMALAYDGDVYLAEDTDGDGLEDRANVFWDNDGRVRSPIGMALTPPEYEHGDGLFIATKSECLLIVDTDDDPQADRVVVVATGWNESFHNVDALGVAVDPNDQSIFFGLGTANFADPLVKDAQGRPTYRWDGERGAIIKVSPDFTRREVYCSGIRFPVALAFNRNGDLFCTDQEGATWVANGNPFDELLHLVRGRHYGFPPRHPEWLPDVIDEPSVYDYRPQHQSTCGLIFNEAQEGGSAFGPGFWSGDALVCGYSRGKLYRTKLVPTKVGYVADNRLLACLNMLTVDSCVSPQGNLVVAVHSGGPDWGSGPSGQGKLYRVSYVDRLAPQPVATWTAGPNEVHVAFDSALDARHLRHLVEATKITYGDYVAAGDEFESLRPGYEVVARQLVTPRHELHVHSAQVTPDLHTLILVTDSHREPVHYALRLPALGRPPIEVAPGSGSSNVDPGAPLPQYARVDLDYSLQGVAAQWLADGDKEKSWTGWLPHLDPAVSQPLMAGSANHGRFHELIRFPGRLRLRTQIDLSNMLRPAVQPGSKLDYELTPEAVTLRFESSDPFTLRTVAGESSADKREGHYVATAIHVPNDEPRLAVEIEITTERGDPQLTVAWHTAEDSRLRAMPLRRLLVPWAAPRRTSPGVEGGARVIPELAEGSWARGRKLFLSEEALCSKCHALRGQGGAVGPDLSNLVHRDYASVLRDVTEPSYAINPDYITHSVELTDGRTISGTLRQSGDELLISDTQGNVTQVSSADVEMSSPTSLSIMPDDVARRLTAEQLRDLLTFLLMPPPHMPLDGAPSPPPAPTLEQLNRVLAGALQPAEPTRPVRVVLVAGNKDHGPGEHDYPAWQTAWAELLSAAEKTTVGTAWDWPTGDDVDTADVLVFYQQGTWTPERARDIDAFLGRGGGLVYIHYAVDGGPDAPAFAQRIGWAWQGGHSKFRHGPLELGFDPSAGHPISRNFSQVKFVDESYWNLVQRGPRPNVIASAPEEGEPQPLMWTLQPSRGRVFVSIPGHYSWTFDDPLFRVLLLRGIAWTAREPVDRFNDVVTIGARLSETNPD